MTPRNHHAERRVQDALGLRMKVRLLADSRAELKALERAIELADASGLVTAALAAEAQAGALSAEELGQYDVEQALRDAMAH